ncbi:MAG: type transport system permease protein [Chloroflexota bacterium]|jgi:ABC-type transport system involved in multi-copper enzyme maturation permease subunit|nr:type transport system permease protein [Chloroflexota bacterium]
MLAAFRGELFKFVRRPGVWILVILLLVLAVVIGYAILWLVYTVAPPNAAQGLPPGTTFADFKVTLYPENFVKQTFNTWGSLGGVFALIVGVLAQGSEYGWGTVKTLYTQRSGRLTMLFGKLGAVAVIVLVMVVGLFAVDAGASAVLAAVDGKSLTFPAGDVILKAIGAGFLIFGFWAVFGITLATLFRQSAMAIGLGLAYGLVVEMLIFALFRLGGIGVQQVQQWFPIANTGYLSDSFGRVTIKGVTVAGAGAPYADATHAVVVLVLYVIVFTAITVWFTRTRDVTS